MEPKLVNKQECAFAKSGPTASALSPTLDSLLWRTLGVDQAVELPPMAAQKMSSLRNAWKAKYPGFKLSIRKTVDARYVAWIDPIVTDGSGIREDANAG